MPPRKRRSYTAEYKVEARLYTAADGATERWRYDGESNVVEHVDAAGRITRTEATAFDKPLAQTGSDGARVSYRYDTELRLVAVHNPQGWCDATSTTRPAT
jgi:YD repeat-containing protein